MALFPLNHVLMIGRIFCLTGCGSGQQAFMVTSMRDFNALSKSYWSTSERTKSFGCRRTMFDFHNFGLIFAGIMHCLPQRLKSMLFEIFLNREWPKGTRSVEKISNNIDFSLWGNRATTWEYFLTFSSETKIMKIRHIASGTSDPPDIQGWARPRSLSLLNNASLGH